MNGVHNSNPIDIEPGGPIELIGGAQPPPSEQGWIKKGEKVIKFWQSVDDNEIEMAGDDDDDEKEKLMMMVVDGQSNDYWLKQTMMFVGFNIAHLGYSFLGHTQTDSPSSMAKAKWPSSIVGGLNASGFAALVSAILLRPKKKVVAVILGKIGASATTCGIIVATGLIFLPHNIIWITGFPCVFVCVMIALA